MRKYKEYYKMVKLKRLLALSYTFVVFLILTYLSIYDSAQQTFWDEEVSIEKNFAGYKPVHHHVVMIDIDK